MTRRGSPDADEQRRRGDPVGRAARDQVSHPPLSGGQLVAGPFGDHARQLSFDLGQQRPVSHLGGQVAGSPQASRRKAGPT